MYSTVVRLHLLAIPVALCLPLVRYLVVLLHAESGCPDLDSFCRWFCSCSEARTVLSWLLDTAGLLVARRSSSRLAPFRVLYLLVFNCWGAIVYEQSLSRVRPCPPAVGSNAAVRPPPMGFDCLIADDDVELYVAISRSFGERS